MAFRAYSARCTSQSTVFHDFDSHMCPGLDDMREGDLIALFLGAQVPFVVKEAAPDVYILVG